MTKRKMKHSTKPDPASTGQRTQEETTVCNIPEWPNDAVEECTQCPTSWEPDSYTVFMVKRYVGRLVEVRVQYPLYKQCIGLLLRYAYLLCRNMPLRITLRIGYMGLEQGENCGFKMEMKMVEMVVNFLRKLSKTLNDKQVVGWCKGKHVDKDCWYMSIRKELEIALQAKIEEVRVNWAQLSFKHEWDLATIN